MNVMDGVLCMGRACDKQTRDAFQSSVTLDWVDNYGRL